jgi:DNA-3-methyladenine glycosylase
MYGPVGHAYVYLIYGMHECLNVVAYHDSAAGAVLLRALEPVEGIDLMRRRRGRDRDPDSKLCSGPAKLCQAMAVDRTLNAHDLTSGAELWLSGPRSSPESIGRIAEGSRIGVAYAGGDWAARPLRFWLDGHPSVSVARR